MQVEDGKGMFTKECLKWRGFGGRGEEDGSERANNKYVEA